MEIFPTSITGCRSATKTIELHFEKTAVKGLTQIVAQYFRFYFSDFRNWRALCAKTLKSHFEKTKNRSKAPCSICKNRNADSFDQYLYSNIMLFTYRVLVVFTSKFGDLIENNLADSSKHMCTPKSSPSNSTQGKTDISLLDIMMSEGFM